MDLRSIDDSPFPTPNGKYFWTKLTFAFCDQAYRWFHYDNIHKNVFAQELVQGKWYIRDVETCEFEEFDWATGAEVEPKIKDPMITAQRQAESEARVLYVKMSQNIPTVFDSFKNIVYRYNNKGQQLIPRSLSGFPVFPCNANGTPLFPIDVVTREPEFLYNEDGILTLPVCDQGLVIFPTDLHGQIKFPLDESRGLIWPIDGDGMPYPPLNMNGVPTIRYDANGLPILPYDDSGAQLIMFDSNGIPMKLSEFKSTFTEEQAESWGGGKLPPHLVMPITNESINAPNTSQKSDPDAVDLPNPLPFLPRIIPRLDLPEIPPEYNLAMAKLAARNLSGKFQLEYTIEIKHWEEEMEKRKHQMMKQYSEEREKIEKVKHEEEERKKRLGSFLRTNIPKEGTSFEKKEINAKHLRSEALTKRLRLQEEENKKREEAEKEVQKYYDEVTKREFEKQKIEFHRDCIGSDDIRKEMDGENIKSRKRGNEELDKLKTQRIYVSGERKPSNCLLNRQEVCTVNRGSSLTGIHSDNSNGNEGRHRKQKRHKRSQAREQSEEGEIRKRRSRKRKRHKKHKRDDKTPDLSSSEDQAADLKLSSLKVKKEDIKISNEEQEKPTLTQRSHSIDSLSEFHEILRDDSIKEFEMEEAEQESRANPFALITGYLESESRNMLEEEEDVRKKLLAKQVERANRSNRVENELSVQIASTRRVEDAERGKSEMMEIRLSDLEEESEFKKKEDINEEIFGYKSFQEIAEGYLRQMADYLKEIRYERELLNNERKECKKLLESARSLVLRGNLEEEDGRSPRRRIVHDHRLRQKEESSNISRIHVNPAMLRRSDLDLN